VLPPLPGGVGTAIMAAFELPPSRLIGELKRTLEEAITQGTLEPRREDAYYVAHLARHGLVPGVDPARAAEIAAAGGLVGEAAAAADAREAAGDHAGDHPGVEADAHDGDPDRPRPGVLACGHDPDNDPCTAVGDYEP